MTCQAKFIIPLCERAMPELKAIIFDMDDTLLDWRYRTANWGDHERQHLERIFAYVEENCGKLRGNPTDLAELIRNYSRQAWQDAENSLHAPSYAEIVLNALEAMGVARAKVNIRGCLEAYGWAIPDGVGLFPDVPEALALLKATGVEMAIITNASVPMWMRDIELKACGILDFFGPCRITAADAGYIKPHPIIFEKALAALNIKPIQAVYIGDNITADILGAQRVGMRAILRDIGQPLSNSRSMVKPDGIVKSLLEILPLLDKWYAGWRA
jgi:putative hydrolase of the HAD superfamily